MDSKDFSVTRSHVRYELLKSSDVEEVQNLFSQVFRTQEPLSMALNFQEEEFRPVVQKVCQKAASDKMGIISRDTQTGILLGFSIGKDYGEKETFDTSFTVDEKFLPLFALHEQLDKNFPNRESLTPGSVFLHHTLGVDTRRYDKIVAETHKSIVDTLYTLTYKLASSLGFRKVIGHSSSMFTQRIYKEYGFREVAKIDYKNFEYKGTYPFSKIRWHKSCVMFERVLPRVSEKNSIG